MKVEAVLLCEDEQSACFARRFLKERGYKAWQLREEKPPPGKGSGEQWVRERLPLELRAMRDSQSKALIVLTDADTMSVAERAETLRRKCLDEGVAWRTADEPLVLVIPRRNIETWLAYLRGETVDETNLYPKYAAESDCREQARELHRMCQIGSLSPPPPPSLAQACAEWTRMD
jgi:hypothetical protein